jgi:hypothetical protein
VSAGGDEWRVTQAVLDELRRERPLRLSLVFEGGGEASQVDQTEEPKCERPSGPSHVVDGGGDSQGFTRHQQSVRHWLVRDQLEMAHVEHPIDVRKRELRKRFEDTEHYLTLANRFRSLLFAMKYSNPGRQRRKTLD